VDLRIIAGHCYVSASVSVDEGVWWGWRWRLCGRIDEYRFELSVGLAEWWEWTWIFA
jgi:hypothetical protein